MINLWRQVASRPQTRPKCFARELKKNYQLLLIFILPFVYYIVFHYLPMYGIIISFKKYNPRQGVWGSAFIGLKYYKMFFSDTYFWKVVRNTFLLNLYSLLFGFPIPIFFALLMNEMRAGWYKKLIQTVSCIPHFVSLGEIARTSEDSDRLRHTYARQYACERLLEVLDGHCVQEEYFLEKTLADEYGFAPGCLLETATYDQVGAPELLDAVRIEHPMGITIFVRHADGNPWPSPGCDSVAY